MKFCVWLQYFIKTSSVFHLRACTYRGPADLRPIRLYIQFLKGFPGGSVGKESAPNAADQIRTTPWRRKWQLTSPFLPGKSHGLEPGGYSPHGQKEADMTEQLNHCHHHSLWNIYVKSIHFTSLKLIGKLELFRLDNSFHVAHTFVWS